MTGHGLLYAAAAAFAAGGLALQYAPAVLPAGARAEVAAAPPAGAGPRRQPVVQQSAFSPIVSKNAFSADRQPPKVRFVPEGLRRDTAAAPRAPKKPAEPPARLFGITRGPGGAVALIDADPKVPGAEVYRVGDEVRGGRITNISETTVTLTRPSGSTVLHLPDARERR